MLDYEPAMWNAIRVFLDEVGIKGSSYVQIQVRLVNQENLQPVEREEYRPVNQEIQELWGSFNDGEMTWKHLLRPCGKIYGCGEGHPSYSHLNE